VAGRDGEDPVAAGYPENTRPLLMVTRVGASCAVYRRRRLPPGLGRRIGDRSAGGL